MRVPSFVFTCATPTYVRSPPPIPTLVVLLLLLGRTTLVLVLVAFVVVVVVIIAVVHSEVHELNCLLTSCVVCACLSLQPKTLDCELQTTIAGATSVGIYLGSRGFAGSLLYTFPSQTAGYVSRIADLFFDQEALAMRHPQRSARERERER